MKKNQTKNKKRGNLGGPMESLRKFVDKNLGYLIVIPALLFIVIFSLYPIVQSVKYSLFDYALNNPQKNNTYIGLEYNLDKASEDVFYVNYYLKDELPNVTDSATKEEIQSTIDYVNTDYASITSQFSQTKGYVKITSKQYAQIKDFNTQVQNDITQIYSTSGENFVHKTDSLANAQDLGKTLITSNFIGFGNYLKALKDPNILHSLLITLIFTIASVSLEFVFGMALALIMNKSLKGKGIIRTTSLIPWAIPTTVAALMWAYMFDAQSGIIAHILYLIHIIPKTSFLLSTGNGALISIIFADIWKTTPYMALLLLAGLQVIPNAVYESSSIDGATKIQQFFKITVPLLKPSILVALLFRTLDAFRVFDLIYVLTHGGPGGETMSISVISYQTMEEDMLWGYGSVIVIIMAIIVGIISFVYIKILGVNLTGENE